jgi:hypothetical protein
MNGLVAFLAARLGEDEADAKNLAAGEGTLALAFAAHSEVPRKLGERLLREVAAKRAILALHRIEVTFAESRDNDYRPVKIPEVQCFVCGWASDVEGSACETLRNLAAVYSEHPDYGQEWRNGCL